jgi:dinuclear metal center YbgI/SA1388 family protein
MTALETVCNTLAQIAPLRLAESWDNVGLLVGDRKQTVSRVMTCLTITPNVVEEAVREAVDLIVVHHPLPFKALQKITTDSVTGAMLLNLIGARVAIYSAHTAFDSALEGINQMWAQSLGLQSIEPLVVITEPADSAGSDGSGRLGRLPTPLSLDELVSRAAKTVGAIAPRKVGKSDQQVSKVAFACGSGGSFLAAAKRRGCDALITGEATFHSCLEAEAWGIGLGLLGHYWSERFAMERLAVQLSDEFPSLAIWPSQSEHDPISWVDA